MGATAMVRKTKSPRMAIACGACGRVVQRGGGNGLGQTVSAWFAQLRTDGWSDIAPLTDSQTTHGGRCGDCAGSTAGTAPPRVIPADTAPAPEPLGGLGEFSVRFIPLDQLVPTPDNPRFLPQDPAVFDRLVASVKAHKVMVPVMGRPHPDPDKHHLIDLRAGSRRLAAARAAGLADIPCIVRAMSDAQAMELTAWENIQREDLHPVEEARAIDLLFKAGLNVAAIAERWGVSDKWVLRRHSLMRLSARWMNEIRAGSHPIIRELGAGHFEAIARLPEDIQDNTLKDYFGTGSITIDIPTVDALAADLAREAKDLGGAVWKLDDAGLHAKAGACSACPKRTGASPVLFDLGPKGGDQCLDAACWDRKVALTISAKRKELAEAHGGEVVLIGDAWQAKEDKVVPPKDAEKIRQRWDVQIVKKGTPGAKPAIEVTGPGAGRTVWVKPPAKGGDAARGSRDGAKVDPREAVERRRRKRFVGLVNERLLSKGSKSPVHAGNAIEERSLVLLLLTMCARHPQTDDFLYVFKLAEKKTEAQLWDQLAHEVRGHCAGVAREHMARPDDVKVAGIIAGIWGLDAKALQAEVEAEHPLPGAKKKSEGKKPKRGGLEAGAKVETSKRQQSKAVAR